MKNQYFGDVNDYKKYCIIRLLAQDLGLSTTVCWMLTPDDARGDGRRVGYLKKPRVWRKYDPVLFDYLKSYVVDYGRRTIKVVQNNAVLGNCNFFDRIITDDPKDRADYFLKLSDITKNSDVVFLDPDNGLEVASVPYGGKNSSKYVYQQDVRNAYESGCSVLVYQHFPRRPHDKFVKDVIDRFEGIGGLGTVVSFCTSTVVFFLLLHKWHENVLKKGPGVTGKRFDGLADISFHDLRS